MSKPNSTLTAERLRQILDYDPRTGRLTWAMTRGRAHKGKEAGHLHGDGYRGVCVDGSQIQAHRVAWLHYYGEWPRHQIDHINGDKADNRICNLRDVPQVVNLHNLHTPQTNNSSGVRGVSWLESRRRFQVQIQVGGKKKHLGMYKTIEAAEAAYLAAKAAVYQAPMGSLGSAIP